MNAKRALAAAQLLLMFPGHPLHGRARRAAGVATATRTGAFRWPDRNPVRGENVDTLGPAHHPTTCRVGYRLRHAAAELE
jgi:hypothetical protein